MSNYYMLGIIPRTRDAVRHKSDKIFAVKEQREDRQ